MFAPFKVSGFHDKILSIFKTGSPLNAGSLVDIDPTDTSAVTSSVGFNSLTGGTVKLASISVASNGGLQPSGASTNAAVAANFGRELGIAIPTVSTNGPTLQERILELASSYMTVPVGAAIAVLKTSPGDIVSTTEYNGYQAADIGSVGFLDTTSVGNYGAPCGIFNGRFRLVQTTDAVRARYIGNTTVNGALVGLFELA